MLNRPVSSDLNELSFSTSQQTVNMDVEAYCRLGVALTGRARNAMSVWGNLGPQCITLAAWNRAGLLMYGLREQSSCQDA